MAMTNRGNFTHRMDEPGATLDTTDVDFGPANGNNLLNTPDDDDSGSSDGDDTRANPPMAALPGSTVAHNAGCRCEVCGGPVPGASAL